MQVVDFHTHFFSRPFFDALAALSTQPGTPDERLARVGLVHPREGGGRIRLGQFIDDYLAQRQDLKASTITAMRQSRIWLVRFLGEDRQMVKVTVSDADAYRAHMIESKLAKATIAKRCRYARHFFDVAKRRGLVDSNPFGHIAGSVVGNTSRRAFVSGDVVQKVMDVAPDPQWRLLIALARWGGV